MNLSSPSGSAIHSVWLKTQSLPAATLGVGGASGLPHAIALQIRQQLPEKIPRVPMQHGGRGDTARSQCRCRQTQQHLERGWGMELQTGSPGAAERKRPWLGAPGGEESCSAVPGGLTAPPTLHARPLGDLALIMYLIDSPAAYKRLLSCRESNVSIR